MGGVYIVNNGFLAVFHFSAKRKNSRFSVIRARTGSVLILVFFVTKTIRFLDLSPKLGAFFPGPEVTLDTLGFLVVVRLAARQAVFCHRLPKMALFGANNALFWPEM